MWILFALLFSMTSAVFSGINRVYKMEGFRLNFYRMFFSLILLSPMTLFIDFPKNPLFYMAAITHGVSMVIGTAVILNMASKHNGRIATMYIPVQIFASFALWIAISPNMWDFYLKQPANIIYVMFPFALMSFALFSMRKADASFKLFLQIAPIGFIYALADTIAKLGSADTAFMQNFAYLYVVFNTGLVCATPFLFIPKLRIRPDEPLMAPEMLKPAFMLALVGLVSFMLFLTALQLSPNPAYVTAIGTLTPVWLMFYNHYTNENDGGDKRTAILMIISALALVILTA